MDDFQFGEALRKIHDFLWSEYCDWYIEIAKIRLQSDGVNSVSPMPVLLHVLETSLKMLHPYMPFITEELWQNLRHHLPEKWQDVDSVMIAPYPEGDTGAIDPEAEHVMEAILEIIRSIRNTRAEHKVDVNKWIEAHIYSGELTSAIAQYEKAIQTLARAKPVVFLKNEQEQLSAENSLSLILKESRVIIPMSSMVDLESERIRLQAEIEQMENDLSRLNSRLNNRQFLKKAPAQVVDKERARLAERQNKLSRLKQELSRLTV